jgi:hypothetical protein
MDGAWIMRSQLPDVEVGGTTVPGFVLERARELGDKPALIDAPSGRSLSHCRLAAGVERVAAGLAARGFRPGDVLAISSPNLPEYPLAAYGAMVAGGAVTTANPLLTAGELAGQLADSGARALVTVAPFLERVLPAAEKAGVGEVFVLGAPPEGGPAAGGAAGPGGAVASGTPAEAGAGATAPGPRVTPFGALVAHDHMERWAGELPHQQWWRRYLRDTGGTGFWHETYLLRGGMEAVYVDMNAPVGLARVAPTQPARGPMFSARSRVGLPGSATAEVPVAEEELRPPA